MQTVIYHLGSDLTPKDFIDMLVRFTWPSAEGAVVLSARRHD